MWGIWAVFIFFIIIYLYISDFKIRPQLSFLTYPFLLAIGLWNENVNFINIITTLLSGIIFILSSIVATRKATKFSSDIKTYVFNRFFFWIVVLLIIYHFAVGGIPALSSNVAQSRFDNTSSGLLGIPGRMKLYGPDMLFFYTCYFHYRRDIFPKYKKYDKYFYIAILVEVLTALSSGSKSSVLGLWVLILYYFVYRNKDISIKRFFNRKVITGIVVIGILGMAYFAFYFKRYNNQYSEMNMVSYIIYRSTSLMGEGATYIFNNKDAINIPFWYDLIYYLQKYFHVSFCNSTVMPLEVAVSNSINHITYTNAYAFYVPITIGAFPELMYFFSFGVLPLSLILGILFGYIYDKIRKVHSPFEFSSLCLLLSFFADYISKGGTWFHIINYFLIYCIFFIFYQIGKNIRIPAVRLNFVSKVTR